MIASGVYVPMAVVLKGGKREGKKRSQETKANVRMKGGAHGVNLFKGRAEEDSRVSPLILQRITGHILFSRVPFRINACKSGTR